MIWSLTPYSIRSLYALICMQSLIFEDHQFSHMAGRVDYSYVPPNNITSGMRSIINYYIPCMVSEQLDLLEIDPADT